MKVKNSVIDFLLGHFRTRPGMFLGRNHISLLSIFMTGYQISLNQNNIDTSSDPFFKNEHTAFFNWFKNKRGYTNSSSWYHTILEECHGSEENALELFFTLLEEYNSALKAIK